MENYKNYSSETLAFIGDAVFELMARTSLIENGDKKLETLNAQADLIVNASSQSKFCQSIIPLFSEEEAAVFRRGKNAASGKTKSASFGEYAKATGLESVFGFLYIEGKYSRIKELFNSIIEKQAVSQKG